jgi:WD40 repeat protein
MTLTLLIPALLCGADAEPRTLEGHRARCSPSPSRRTGRPGQRQPGQDDQLWDARTGKLERTLTDHTEDVYSVVFSPRETCWPAAVGTRQCAVESPDRQGDPHPRGAQRHCAIRQLRADQKTLASAAWI